MGQRGFSLLEVVIAMVVLAIAMLGVLGLLLATQQHNASTSEATLATKACQEVTEQLRAMSYDSMLAQNGISFVAKRIHPSQPVGEIEVVDDSPTGEPDTKAEIKVRIRTQPGQVSKSAINVELVTKRSRR